MLLDGLHVPLTVPFYPDGAVYLRKLEHNVRRLSLTPASALVAMGFGSEAQSLSDAETAAVLRSVGESAAREKVLVARIERSSVFAALETAATAAEASFDAVLVPVPALWHARSGSSTGSMYLQSVADRSPLPVVLWSGEGTVHATLGEHEVAELAAHPNIIGMYDVALDLDRLRALQKATAGVHRDVAVTTVFAPVTGRMLQAKLETALADFVSADALSGGVALAVAPPRPALKTRVRSVGFQILGAGTSQALCDLLQAGVAGVSPILAAPAPQACHEVLAAWKDGDPALAQAKQDRLAEADAVCGKLGRAAVKYACDRNGYYGGPPRLPYVGLTADQRAEVDAAFRYVQN